MKAIINYRHPIVDRFLEIIATAKKQGNYFKIHIFNQPKIYDQFLYDLDIFDNVSDDISKCDFFITYPEVHFQFLFVTFETVANILSRIKESELKPLYLDEKCKSIIEESIEKLSLSIDQVNNIIILSNCIASIEKSEIHPVHISEAIRYLKNSENK